MISIKKRMEELEQTYIDIRRKIHSNPEIAFEEFDTTALIEKELQSYGIETFKNGDKTGIVGVLKGGGEGKTVALRADIDALPLEELTGLLFASKNPGKCHACGHDIHTTTLLACARLLSERKEFINGTVKFIFQPAEEGTRGALTIINNGFIDDVDAIFGAHTWPEMPGGSIGIRKGPMMASSDDFNIKINVVGGHAAHPHKTTDSIAVAAYIMLGLQSIVSRELKPTDNAVITVGKMTAGTARNIIPSEVLLEGTFRCLTPDVREKIRESIERIATFTAQAHCAKTEVSFKAHGFPVINDNAMNEIVEKAARTLLGDEYCLDVPLASLGAEDFSYYLQKKPGAFFRLGTFGDSDDYHLALHNSKLLFNEKAISAGALTECGIVFLYTGSDINKLL